MWCIYDWFLWLIPYINSDSWLADKNLISHPHRCDGFFFSSAKYCHHLCLEPSVSHCHLTNKAYSSASLSSIVTFVNSPLTPLDRMRPSFLQEPATLWWYLCDSYCPLFCDCSDFYFPNRLQATTRRGPCPFMLCPQVASRVPGT